MHQDGRAAACSPSPNRSNGKPRCGSATKSVLGSPSWHHKFVRPLVAIARRSPLVVPPPLILSPLARTPYSAAFFLQGGRGAFPPNRSRQVVRPSPSQSVKWQFRAVPLVQPPPHGEVHYQWGRWKATLYVTFPMWTPSMPARSPPEPPRCTNRKISSAASVIVV